MSAPYMWYQKETSGVSKGTVLRAGVTTSAKMVAPNVLVTTETRYFPVPVVWSAEGPVKVLVKP